VIYVRDNDSIIGFKTNNQEAQMAWLVYDTEFIVSDVKDL